MLTSEAVQAYLNLSNKISALENPNLFLSNLLPGVLQTALQLKYTFECINFLYIDGSVKMGYFYDPGQDKNQILNFTVIDSSLFLSSSELERELLWGKPVISSSVVEIINPEYAKKSEIRSVVLLPILSDKGLKNCLILASKRGADQITGDELEFCTILAQLFNFSLKISEEEVSLTQVTYEVYKMNSELHRINKLKDDFVSIASHELRTPMTAIRSYAWMALNRPDVPLSDKIKRYLQRTLVSTERLINLVNDMLNVSRIESGRIEIAPERFDIQNLVGEVLIEIDAKAKEKNLHFVHNRMTLPMVFADSNKVHQVLLNLLGNALKFTPTGGAITLSYFTDGKLVEISVKDSGTGISKEDIYRLFKKFSRLDNSYIAASSSGGTGLGLYICKSLLELMKGKIWATSEGDGKGSTFIFSLPVATDELVKESEKYHYRPQGEARLLEPVAIQAYPNEPA